MISVPYSTWLLDSSSVVQVMLALIGPKVCLSTLGSVIDSMTGFVVSTVVVVVPPVDDLKNASNESRCQ